MGRNRAERLKDKHDSERRNISLRYTGCICFCSVCFPYKRKLRDPTSSYLAPLLGQAVAPKDKETEECCGQLKMDINFAQCDLYMR
ncbi:hypothetical protein K443DRAFT_619573 [Laccaria amethystina LaAM-08-1]|uniref:Uncharacterized protein n=1 Tax=Laccaria amethystina LaAM-08-1 TaxID=1095629 RepID=A0A0C9XQU0_9AGAR|nr:hypothetical protein K443DRAFT_619573 [Laccaria amethystina LaAM-08-1]